LLENTSGGYNSHPLAPTPVLVHAGNSRRKGVSHDGTCSEFDVRADVCGAEALKPAAQERAGGTQVWAWAPDAFGNGSPSGAATVNLRMPGQFYDAESSLFYNWNRYYNPSTGRYISSDPIGLEGGINTFLYAAASPVMLIDPEGLDTLTMSAG